MLTVVAARKSGGVFSPALIGEERGPAEIYYLKNDKALKKLKKLGPKCAAVAPSAAELAGPLAQAWEGGSEAESRLPQILAGLAALPVGELYLFTGVKRAAELIERCSGCARLFTVVTGETGGQELFDRLYFESGVILRRVRSPASRVGATALCLTETGRSAPGVLSVDLTRLGRLKFYGGPLDPLEEEGLPPTAELYALAGLPLPEKGSISKEHGDKILYLDTGTIL